MSYKILIADDEPEIRDLLRLYLENEKYEVVEAVNGIDVLRLMDDEKPDLIMLDIMMPQMDGYQVLKHIREDNNVPVIMISAKDEDSEKILGLNLGADDYIAKPFNPLEVIARVNSALRRFYSFGATTETETDRKIRVRDLELDPESYTLTKAGEMIELTSVEYKIMELLMSHPGKVYTKQQIYEYAWGDEYLVADNNIMVCISKLRSKLSDENSEYIKTLRGLGYRLEK